MLEQVKKFLYLILEPDKKIVGFEGNIIFDETKPDGTYLKD